MRILSETISKSDLLNSAVVFDGPMVKAVVDIDKGIIGVGAGLHADIEQALLSAGSRQDDLWSINLYPNDNKDFIEFDSMINIRPRRGNRSRSVENLDTQAKIIQVVAKWIQ